MNLYVGVTDCDWFNFLRQHRAVEMNFWHPRNTSEFRAIQSGELFLFKTRYPHNRIVGGAFFVRHTTLPLDLAWLTFGEANGAASLSEFRTKIQSIRHDHERNPSIGCTVLTQPFYLDDTDSLDSPTDWSSNIVMGKTYDATAGEGLRLYEQARAVIISSELPSAFRQSRVTEVTARYGNEQIIRPRLGQGGFRIVVMDEYERRCAITGEKTLPVLEAAHIRPFAEEGPHDISNGIFLRSDLHTLFDGGYITIADDFRVIVSNRIREEFSDGREYYAMHGRELQIVPKLLSHRPAAEFLEWHQNHCFVNS